MLFVRDFLTDQRVFRASGAPERPAVSVILPTWRRCAGGLLQRAVGSVLSQGLGDLELIVVDDGSTDGTADLLAEIQAADARLVHVRHELNCGLPALRVNEGIELARVARRTAIFTVWPAADEDGGVVESQEEILGARFLHRQYSHDYLLGQIREHLPDAALDLEVGILGAGCRAYALRRREGSPGLALTRWFPVQA